MIRATWIAAGAIALLLGVVGMFLPFLPTVPFLLLAAFTFSRSSQRLHDWLLGHPRLGPPIRDWRDRGAIGRRAKWLSTASVLAAPVVTLAMGFGWTVIVVQSVALIAVLLFIWSRSDR